MFHYSSLAVPWSSSAPSPVCGLGGVAQALCDGQSCSQIPWVVTGQHWSVGDPWNYPVLPLCSLTFVQLVCLEPWGPKNSCLVSYEDICLHNHELVWLGAAILILGAPQHPFLPRGVGEEVVKCWCSSNLPITFLQHCQAHPQPCRPAPGLVASHMSSRGSLGRDMLCSWLVAPKFTFTGESCQGRAHHINNSSSCIMQTVCNTEVLKQLKRFEFCAQCTLCFAYTGSSVSCFN